MKNLPLSFTLVSLLSLGSAQAVEYTAVQNDKSSIAFTYQQMGVAVDGKFKRFSSQLSFDPARPAAAKVSFDVDLASVDTGAAEGDQEVAGKPWFNSAVFPTARFVATAIKPLGGEQYEVAGNLTLKGRTQPLVFPARFTSQGRSALFSGSFVMRRADFAIGEGSWAKFDIVANDVLVKFRITAHSQ